MEHCGFNIESVLDTMRIDRRIISQFLHDITIASKFLFTIGLIHRDISLRNICMMVNRQGPSVSVRFTLIDIGLCSGNVDGTIGFKRGTNGIETNMTWMTDIYCIGLCAKLLMNRVVNPRLSKSSQKDLLFKTFSDLINLVDNMLDPIPTNRPDHKSIVKSIAYEGIDVHTDFSTVGLEFRSMLKKEDDSLLIDD